MSGACKNTDLSSLIECMEKIASNQTIPPKDQSKEIEQQATYTTENPNTREKLFRKLIPKQTKNKHNINFSNKNGTIHRDDYRKGKKLTVNENDNIFNNKLSTSSPFILGNQQLGKNIEGNDEIIILRRQDAPTTENHVYRPHIQSGSPVYTIPEYAEMLENNTAKAKTDVAIHRVINIGTVACFLKDDEDYIYLLTSHHIFHDVMKQDIFAHLINEEALNEDALFVYTSTKLPVMADRYPEQSRESRIRQYLGRNYYGCYGVNADDQAMDFALVRLEDEVANNKTVLQPYQNSKKRAVEMEISEDETKDLNNEEVEKDGRVSGITRGEVIPMLRKINVVPEGCAATDGWFFVGSKSGQFTSDGDSGSLIVAKMPPDSTEGTAYGLVFGIMNGPFKKKVQGKNKAYESISVGVRLNHFIEFAEEHFDITGLKLVTGE